MTPDALPEEARLSDEQLARLREENPEMAEILTTLARKCDYLQAQLQPVAMPDATDGDGVPAPVMAAMDAVPELRAWQQDDPDRFMLAIHLDEKLQRDPAWASRSLTERFTEVALRTRAAYGEVPDTTPPAVPASPAPVKPDAAVQEALAQMSVPASPSEVGEPSPPQEDILKQAAEASREDLGQMMSRMSDDQIDALLSRAGY